MQTNEVIQRARLLSRKETAEQIGVREGTLAVWACTRRHSLPYVKVGRLAKYRQSDIDAFIASRVVGGEAQ